MLILLCSSAVQSVTWVQKVDSRGEEALLELSTSYYSIAELKKIVASFEIEEERINSFFCREWGGTRGFDGRVCHYIGKVSRAKCIVEEKLEKALATGSCR